MASHVSRNCLENTLQRGHPARISRRHVTHAAGRMPALQGISCFLGARQRTGMSDCSLVHFEKARKRFVMPFSLVCEPWWEARLPTTV